LQDSTSFTLYNAAAGSGKTFTLVKEYLRILLHSKQEGAYRSMLAITFTNKAVAEMKQRIIESLVLFSEEKSLLQPPEMMSLIMTELDLTTKEIQQRAQAVLKHILHHYAGFGVETIDRFNHHLIRTFARDLKLDSNFEVTLDADQLLVQAVDQLLSKAGEDTKITKTLISFALEKTDDDRSWDISKDIASAAKILLNENEIAHVEELKGKSLDDFTTFKKQKQALQQVLTAELKKEAARILELINEAGLEFSDFSGGYLPKYFEKLATGNFEVSFGLKWQTQLGEVPLYTKTTAKKQPDVAAILDELAPQIEKAFQHTRDAIFQYSRTAAILKNVIPLSVIHLVQKELENIQTEENILPISNFNRLINDEIKHQPAPFIYERLGERYRHFFIDEFQDTSFLQWENLIPLIDNALSQEDETSETGSLLLVGDAKQSIYRWRGGLPEQFINLYNADNPFTVRKQVHTLDTNYRSAAEIINFNNQFFTTIAPFFSDPLHQELYEVGNAQKTNHKEGGYVKIEFIEKQFKSEKDEVYPQKVQETILKLTNAGWELSDICILARYRKDGVTLGSYLMEQGIDVVSSETLLIQNSSHVQLLVAAMQMHIQPANDEVLVLFLDLLHDHLKMTIEKHELFTAFLNNKEDSFLQILSAFGITFDIETLQSISLYEGFEYMIRQFEIAPKADAYLFAFMDLVYDYGQQAQANKASFLDHWEYKRERASIAISEAANAVRLLTVHQAKGLEFPIVLFPYADIDLYTDRHAKLWVPMADEVFSEVQLNYSKEMMNYGEEDAAIYHQYRSTLELDNYNLLYVTLTRAISQLYIFAEFPSAVKEEGPKNTNQLFSTFLQNIGTWDAETMMYEFGTFAPKETNKEVSSAISKALKLSFISTSPESHQLKVTSKDAVLWDTEVGAAIDLGNLLHDTMAEIKTAADAYDVMEQLRSRAHFSEEQLDYLNRTVAQIISHPQLASLFDAFAEVKNEIDIITHYGAILRPDRINFYDKKVVVTDYKTGAPKIEHKDQIEGYAAALEAMGFVVQKKLLVYISSTSILVNNV